LANMLVTCSTVWNRLW